MDKELREQLFEINEELKMINYKLNTQEILIREYVVRDKLMSKNKTIDEYIRDLSTTKELEEYFKEVYKEINDDAKFNTWIKPTISGSMIKDNTIIIACPNAFNYYIILQNYTEILNKKSNYKICLKSLNTDEEKMI